MPNVPEFVSPEGNLLAAAEAAEASAVAAAASAEQAEEGGYPAGKEAAEVVVEPASEPEKGAEKSVELGAPGVVHSIKAVFVGDGAKTSWKVKHELGTLITSTTFHSEAAELPSIQTLVKESKVVSANEIEVVLTTAPAAKATFWLIVQG